MNKLQNDISRLNNRISSLQQEISDHKVENSRLTSQIRSSNSRISSIIEAVNTKDFNKIYSLLKDLSSKGEKDVIKIFCKLDLSEVRDSYGNLNLVQILIEGGYNKETVNKFENNALIEASTGEKTDVVRYLIYSGFDKNSLNQSY